MTHIPNRLSPCRAHPCSREHADLVTTYRALAHAWHVAADRATGGYPADLALYRQSHPAPSFRDFLIHTRRPVADSEVTR